MKGTSIPHTRAMLLTPPSTTAATKIVSTTPVIHGATPSVLSQRVAMALLCTEHPMPMAAHAVKKANKIASHFNFKPRSKAYIGPPNIVPSGILTRYLIASNPSLYLVAMPKTPVSQHHSTAPGPPSATAVATPIILPVPMVAASAVASAPNCDTSPLAPLSRVTESLMAVKIFRCGKASRTVKKRWVPSNKIIMGHPQRKSLTAPMMSLKLCIGNFSYGGGKSGDSRTVLPSS